jgi:hypothetical protein
MSAKTLAKLLCHPMRRFGAPVPAHMAVCVSELLVRQFGTIGERASKGRTAA